jgi:hypothetical protein
VTAKILYARSLTSCKQGLFALAPHIEIQNLQIPCIVGHLPGILHPIPSDLPIITVLKDPVANNYIPAIDLRAHLRTAYILHFRGTRTTVAAPNPFFSVNSRNRFSFVCRPHFCESAALPNLDDNLSTRDAKSLLTPSTAALGRKPG